MLSICLAYVSTDKLFDRGILFFMCVHMIGICTVYSMHTVTKGRLWLEMRVLYGGLREKRFLFPFWDGRSVPQLNGG